MQKLNNVSLLRIVSTICIFFCHLVYEVFKPIGEPYWYFPLHFGVQIFMFISGYLYGKKDIKSYKNYIKQRFSVLLIPYYIYILILFTSFAIYDHTLITLSTFMQGIFCFNLFGHSTIFINHFWYLFYALVSYLFIPWLIALRNHWQKKINLSVTKTSLIYGLIGFLVLLELFVAMFLDGQVTFTCLLAGFFFSARSQKKEGQTTSKEYNTLTWKDNKFQICLYTFLFLGFSVLFYFVVTNRLLLPLIWDNLLLKYSTAIVGVTFSILFISAFKFLNTKTLIAPLRFFDGMSYYFYITHQLFLINGTSPKAQLSFLYVTPYFTLNILIAFAVTLASAYLLKLVSQPLINLILKRKK